MPQARQNEWRATRQAARKTLDTVSLSMATLEPRVACVVVLSRRALRDQTPPVLHAIHGCHGRCSSVDHPAAAFARAPRLRLRSNCRVRWRVRRPIAPALAGQRCSKDQGAIPLGRSQRGLLPISPPRCTCTPSIAHSGTHLDSVKGIATQPNPDWTLPLGSHLP